MSNTISLSYIVATKNKLPYLKQGLEKLIAQKKSDEEILVVDGASTDGTKEYLEELKLEGKIDNYVSEPDYCESHALNKLFLKARGTLIKIITDDDAYHFQTINKCKEFMLSHPDIDILGMEGGSVKHATPNKLVVLRVAGYVDNYRKWKRDHTPFEFAGLGIMFRRASLPILGFWDLSFKNADAEYTFRSTAGPAKLAWCLSPAFVFIRTLEGVTLNNQERMFDETIRLRKFYLNEDPASQTKIAIKNILRNMKRILLLQKKIIPDGYSTPWKKLYIESEEWLIQKNKGREVKFLWNK